MEEVLGTILTSANLVSTDYTAGYFLTYGKTIPEPDTVCVIRASGGITPEVGIKLNYPTVQILVRGDTGTYLDTKAHAVKIRNALHAYDITTAGSTLSGIIAQGDILYVGDDDKDRPMFSLNFRMYEASTTPDNREDV